MLSTVCCPKLGIAWLSSQGLLMSGFIGSPSIGWKVGIGWVRSMMKFPPAKLEADRRARRDPQRVR